MAKYLYNLGVLFLCTALPLHSAIGANEDLCKGHPYQVSACYWVRGLVALTASAGVMLFPDDEGRDTDIRLLGSHDMPKHMYSYFDESLHVGVEGDYEVCRFADGLHPGNGHDIVHYGCINAAKNLVVIKPEKN